MNINKKLGRVKQWAGEKIGNEAKTGVSDEFKSLEMEMALRHEGMERMQKSMTVYIKSLSKRTELEEREKALPVGYLGQTMINHGEEFEPDSEFGNCLISFGRTNERIARTQETYIADATAGWLESLERSLAMMKEYQAARKKLENRRLAYDASLSKMQKAKKEDFRVEEELRAQKAKYEESSEDVYRRMQDIKEAEQDSINDLGTFVDAELEYYDKCREELLRLKREWPAGQTPGGGRDREPRSRNPRSRSNTAHSYSERYSSYEEPVPVPEIEARPSIRSSRVASNGRLDTHDEYSATESPRPSFNRSSTFQGPTTMYREPSSIRKSSVPADPGMLRAGLRPTNSRNNLRSNSNDLFSDPSDDSTFTSGSPDRSYRDRSVSPATSHSSVASRTANYSISGGPTAGSLARKGPPPPPPTRAKKPPPPLPVKRAESVGRY